MPWSQVKQNYFEIILKFLKSIISHVTKSDTDTEIKLFQPLEEF